MGLIQTRAKERLPKGFSYPLEAKAISAALGDVPQLGNASIWFVWRDEYWASDWQSKLKARGEVMLLEVTHSPLSGKRELRAYSVPSEYSIAARERLLAELPGVRLILLTPGHSSGTQRIVVRLDLSEAGQSMNQSRQTVPGNRPPWNMRPAARRSSTRRRDL